MEYRWKIETELSCKRRKERSVTSSTENDNDGLGTNMRLEKFVGLLRRPKFLSLRLV